MSIIDNVKEIANLVKKIDDIDLYRRIIELESEIIELTRENHELKVDNHDLKEKLNLSEALVFRKPFYYKENDDTPYCPRCWEADRKAIHLNGPIEDMGDHYHFCPVCNFRVWDSQ